MVILGIIVIGVIVSGIVFAIFHPTFGAPSEGESLKRIESSQHYKDGHFQNIVPVGVMDRLDENDEGEKFSMFGSPEGKNPREPLPSVAFDVQSLEEGASIWLGHSSVLARLSGKNIMIDPVFNRASPLPIFGKPFEIEHPIAQEDLPQIDIVVISHNHYDHLDYKAIKKFGNTVEQYLVPLGLKAYLMRWGIEDKRIAEFDWYESATIDDTHFSFVPSQHFSGRNVHDRGKTLWGGWVVQSRDIKMYISGDGGYSQEFKKIGEKYGPFDIAFIENGAYNKRWSQVHLFPEQVAQAALDLKAHAIVPVHWAKFDLSDHAWDEPITRLLVAAEEMNVRVSTPQIGEVFYSNQLPQSMWWEDVKK